jgi:RimJ/RimL family protein N-acetyltransferase
VQLSETAILTPRLVLGELTGADIPRLFEYRSAPTVRRFQGFEPQCLDDARRFIETGRSVALGEPGAWHQLGIRLRNSSELVGDIGVRYPTERPNDAEIGITVASDSQRRGIAAESLTGLLGYLFDHLSTHRVFASVDPLNIASMALFDSLGMRRESRSRQSLWFKGSWVDEVVFAMLKSEWQQAVDR